MKYQINHSATLLSKKVGHNKYIIQFLLDGSRKLHRFFVSSVGKDILVRLYDLTSYKSIVNEFNVSEQELNSFLKPLIDAGLVVSEQNIVDTKLFGLRNVRSVEFFRSFFTTTNTTKSMMCKLLESSILILGIGGVGSWVVEMLARIGVGNLIIIDDDIVELSNVPRQAIFTLNDVGKRKVDVVKNYIQGISEHASVTALPVRIKKASDLIPYLNGVRLVINCADKPDVDTTNAWTTKACFKKGLIPHILCGGYDGHLSFLGQTVIPYKSSCWFCYKDGKDQENKLDGFKIIERKLNDHVGGTICPIASQIASIQAQEAIKVITGCVQPLMLNSKAEVDFISQTLVFTEILRNKHCKNCGK